MNNNKYDKLVSNYVSKIDMIYDEGHREYFKWKAVAQCRGEWNLNAENFETMFWNAFCLSGNLIETATHKPISGIVKVASNPEDAEPIREAFRILLEKADPMSAEIDGVLAEFVTSMNRILCRSLEDEVYYQNLQDAVMYLAFIEPERFHLFRPELLKSISSRLELIECEQDAEWTISQCYHASNVLLEQIRKDICLNATLDRMLSLQEERDGRVAGMYTKMPGKQNIMAYELMYTAEIYGLYNGIRRTANRKTVERKMSAADLKREHYIGERNRLQSLKERYENDLRNIEYPEVTDLAVSSKKYGEGRVLSHVGNIIAIEFNEGVKKFSFPDCFTNGFVSTADEKIMDVCGYESELRNKIKKIEGNISTVGIIINKIS